MSKYKAIYDGKGLLAEYENGELTWVREKPNKGHRSKSKVTGYGEFGGGKSEYHGIGEYMEVDSKSRYYDLDKWFDNIIDKII